MSKLILRFHASIMIVATLALTLVGALGFYKGLGPYGDILSSEPIGYIGLFQAYMLMNCMAIVLVIGSTLENVRTWHLVGILAHVYPFIANLLFWSQIEAYGISHAGLVLHIPFMLLEGYGYFSYKEDL